MLRSDFQALARIRLREVRRLLDAKEWCGAYYLTGIAVECALKACIAKRTQKYEFPDKEHAVECWTHDPATLVKKAGLQGYLVAECKNASFDGHWGTVKDWKVASRYDGGVSEWKARALYKAVVARPHGVLLWLRQHW